MNLLLDLGNSRCKYAVLEPGAPDKLGALPYQEGKRLEVIESVLQQYNHLDRVVVCSVLGQEVNDQLQQRFLSNGPEGFYFLSSAAWSFGITIGYRNPGTLGADRLAALIAAHEQYHGCTCIVDCGTAVTVDVLDRGGVHRGGVIFPGFRSMQASLRVDTCIDFDEATRSLDIPAYSTGDAIYTGCLSAVAGGVKHAVDSIQVHCSPFDQIILTGGDAELLMPLLALEAIYKPYWVLEGLKYVSVCLEK